MSEAPPASNGPLLHGLISVWNRNFLGFATHGVFPYSQQLLRFPAYLQQLDMESNGKSVRLDGSPVNTDSGHILWGEPGTNGQHAFYQLVHQGTTVIPADLIGFLEPAADAGGQHELLFANMVAQAKALAFGRTSEEPQRNFTGNRPTTVITATKLTPNVLGQLVAFYEHSVFTQGVIYGINSFDQWGVELGKELASAVVADLRADAFDTTTHDASTSALIELYRRR